MSKLRKVAIRMLQEEISSADKKPNACRKKICRGRNPEKEPGRFRTAELIELKSIEIGLARLDLIQALANSQGN